MDHFKNGELSQKYCPAGGMYADFFTKPIQGATFQRFQAMIQGIPESTLDVYTSFPIAMPKVTSQECVSQKSRQTQGTSTTSTDGHGETCTHALARLLTDTQTRGRTSNDAHRSMCMVDNVSACTDATCTEDFVIV